MDQIVMGCEVKDKITGYRGIVTGRVSYISGCDQALVAGKEKNGDIKTAWFDVQRLERIGKKVIVLDNSKTPGADVPPPAR